MFENIRKAAQTLIEPQEEVVCTAIRIELSNGKMLTADGPAAEEIWKWWLGMELFGTVHGAKYEGAKLIEWNKKDA